MHIDPIGPLDVAASVEMFRRSGDDLLDRWDGTTLVRVLPISCLSVAVACTVSGTAERPRLRIQTEGEQSIEVIRTAVCHTFVEAPAQWGDLVREDQVLMDLDARFPGVRPVLQPDLFSALVRSVSAQQVNLRWASITRRRLALSFGTRHEVAGYTVYHLDPRRIALEGVDAIRSLQFTTRKAEYVVGIADEIASRRLVLDELADLSDDEIVARLTSIRGIGLWTAEWVLARVLGRPRVVAGDLGVRKAVGQVYLQVPIATEAEVRRVTAHWGESAGIAQTLLLHSVYHSGASKAAARGVYDETT